MDPSELDQPQVVAQVRAAFDAYEGALLRNDVEEMTAWFWDDPRVVRYGLAEQQYGARTIAAWRRDAAPVPADRKVIKVAVTAFGPDVACVDCEFQNGSAAPTGRQSQTWVRLDGAWRIARAHVSMAPLAG